MLKDIKSYSLNWLMRGLWLLEGLAATLGWLYASLHVSAAIRGTILGFSLAWVGEELASAIAALAVVGFTLWRRGLPQWLGGLGMRLGFFSAVGFAILTIIIAANGAVGVALGAMMASFGVALFAACAWYQPEAVRHSLNEIRQFLDGAGSFTEQDCFDEAITPTLWLVCLSVAVYAALDPQLIVQLLEKSASYYGEGMSADNPNYIARPPVLPSLLWIRDCSIAAAGGFALSFCVSLRRRGHGSLMRGAAVWLPAIGQAAGFVLAPVTLLASVEIAVENPPFYPAGWRNLAISAVAAVIGFGCYRLRQKWRPGISSSSQIAAG